MHNFGWRDRLIDLVIIFAVLFSLHLIFGSFEDVFNQIHSSLN